MLFVAFISEKRLFHIWTLNKKGRQHRLSSENRPKDQIIFPGIADLVTGFKLSKSRACLSNLARGLPKLRFKNQELDPRTKNQTTLI